MADASISMCLAAYLAVGFALFAWLAYRCKEESIRAAFWLMFLWPLTLLVVVPVVLLDWIGWRVNIERRPDLSPFGFRRRDIGRGWAVRFLRLELQVWKDTRPA